MNRALYSIQLQQHWHRLYWVRPTWPSGGPSFNQSRQRRSFTSTPLSLSPSSIENTKRSITFNRNNNNNNNNKTNIDNDQHDDGDHFDKRDVELKKNITRSNNNNISSTPSSKLELNIQDYITHESDPNKIITFLKSSLFNQDNYNRDVDDAKRMNIIKYMARTCPQKMTIDVINLYLKHYSSYTIDSTFLEVYNMIDQLGLDANGDTFRSCLTMYLNGNMYLALGKLRRVDIIHFIVVSIIDSPSTTKTALADLSSSLGMAAPAIMANLILLSQLSVRADVARFLEMAVLKNFNEDLIGLTTNYLISFFLRLDTYHVALKIYLNTNNQAPSIKKVRFFFHHDLKHYIHNESNAHRDTQLRARRHLLCINYWTDMAIRLRQSSSLMRHFENPIESDLLQAAVRRKTTNRQMRSVFGDMQPEDMKLQSLIDTWTPGTDDTYDNARHVISHLCIYNFENNRLPFGDLIIQAAQVIQCSLSTVEYFETFLPLVPSPLLGIFLTSAVISRPLQENLQLTINHLLPPEALQQFSYSPVVWNDMIVGALHAHHFDLAKDLLHSLLENELQWLLPQTLALFIDYLLERRLDPTFIIECIKQRSNTSVEPELFAQMLFNCQLHSFMCNGDLGGAMDHLHNNDQDQQSVRNEITYRLAASLYILLQQQEHHLALQQAQDLSDLQVLVPPKTQLTFEMFQQKVLPLMGLEFSHEVDQHLYAIILEEFRLEGLLNNQFALDYVNSAEDLIDRQAINQDLLKLLMGLLTARERVVLFIKCSINDNNMFSDDVLAMVEQANSKTVKSPEVEETLVKLRQRRTQSADQVRSQQHGASVNSHNFSFQPIQQRLMSIEEIKNIDLASASTSIDRLATRSHPTCSISQSTISIIRSNFIEVGPTT
ncbi:hypothetical protein SAMD00019534_120320 [Acytostelium subglobosum LB1]|uniref:hypothetical protein n=1 Tax=Acytostelium subglobosum LB1 TaxID=1410327 RepID=UPI000645092D|nr:hypothetical protein SAMD00019534_120320 [Acytostelium subglobosum LB1]GAM28856.1 hypothetical protein SAMD00019534_120320 [Acytostelium subglobosum LB1]|eukprot:XP_012748228.1 hypothetical protein SAMD00019534_120320 [Acytostelium subglobosum LB1]